jgi:nucleoside-diphosphate-sugar epimerase
MAKEKILVIGASGQIGVELTLALRKIYGASNVIASDLREQNELLQGTGPYVSLDVMNKEMLHVQVIRQGVTQIYLLAAILSATGEKNPNLAWHLNMQGLLNVLDIAREEKLSKVYWPSSIAVFGPTSPKKIVLSKLLLSRSLFMALASTPVSSGVIISSINMAWMFVVFATRV